MAAKKTPAVAPAKRGRKPKEQVFHVLSKRTSLFAWQPYALYETYTKAADDKKRLEAESPLSIKGYKITSVTLVK